MSGQDIIKLTEREQEILKLLAEGLTNREIACQLNVTVRTVEAHLTNTYHKLGAKSRCDALNKAIKSGWIELE